MKKLVLAIDMAVSQLTVADALTLQERQASAVRCHLCHLPCYHDQCRRRYGRVRQGVRHL